MAEKPVAYDYDGRKFEGMLVYDEAVSAKRPAIFMQPDWLGVCRHSIDMAHEVAAKELEAARAALTPEYNLHGSLATTHSCAPMLMFNGPVRKDLNINCSSNCFGQGRQE